MKFGKWFISLISNPVNNLKKIIPELSELKIFLKKVEKTQYPLTDIVNFFNAISWWHDRGLGDIIAIFDKANYGQYNTIISNLKKLESSFSSAGRCEFGWNRTRKGEIVTEDRVFLGNVFGLFTHPVSFWKQGKNEPKGNWGFPNMGHLNAYDVVSRQALDFIRKHAKKMTGTIEQLEKLAA